MSSVESINIIEEDPFTEIVTKILIQKRHINIEYWSDVNKRVYMLVQIFKNLMCVFKFNRMSINFAFGSLKNLIGDEFRQKMKAQIREDPEFAELELISKNQTEQIRITINLADIDAEFEHSILMRSSTIFINLKSRDICAIRPVEMFSIDQNLEILGRCSFDDVLTEKIEKLNSMIIESYENSEIEYEHKIKYYIMGIKQIQNELQGHSMKRKLYQIDY